MDSNSSIRDRFIKNDQKTRQLKEYIAYVKFDLQQILSKPLVFTFEFIYI